MTAPDPRPFSVGFIVAALTLPLCLMGALALRVPYLREMPSHVIDAGRIWQGTIDCDAVYRLPLGYAGYIAPFLTAFGEPAGVKAANLLAFAGLLAAALALFARASSVVTMPAERRLFGFSLRQVLALAMVVALSVYPYAIFNMARASEAMPAAAALLVFFWVMTRPLTASSVVIAALCLGLGMHLRPNMISLLVPAAVWLALGARPMAGKFKLALLGIVVMGVAYIAGGAAISGCALYSPTNGGYNLYAGNNPFSASYLASQQNGEYSLLPALQAQGLPGATVEDAYRLPQDKYVALARSYLADCPICVVKLAALKAAVFFSPRLANVDGKAEMIVQIAVATPIWLALGLAIWRVSRRRSYLDGMLLVIVAAYALPFIATNADPRMRFPLDMTALCYLAVRAYDAFVYVAQHRDAIRAGAAA